MSPTIALVGHISAGKTTLIYNILYCIANARTFFRRTGLENMKLTMSLAEGTEYKALEDPDLYDPRNVKGTEVPRHYYRVSITLEQFNASLGLIVLDGQGQNQIDVLKAKASQAEATTENNKLDSVEATILLGSERNTLQQVQPLAQRYNGTKTTVYCFNYNKEAKEAPLLAYADFKKMHSNLAGWPVCEVSNYNSNLIEFHHSALKPFFYILDRWYPGLRLVEMLQKEMQSD